MVTGENTALGNLAKLCEAGRLDDALHTVNCMRRQGVRISSIFYSLLQVCILRKTLTLGRNIGFLIAHSGYGTDNFLGTHLIRMFSSCGSVPEALEVFRKLPYPNTHAWSAVISANVKHGRGLHALTLYQELKQSRVKPDQHIYVAALQGCGSISTYRHGKLIHLDIVESGLQSNGFVGGALVHMYSKCGSLSDAWGVFDLLPERDVVTWSSMIAGYADHGYSEDARWLYNQMQEEGTCPNKVTFISILKAFSDLDALPQGKLTHALFVEHGCELDTVVGNALISMYCNCGGLDDGRCIFDKLQERDVVTWGAIINGYASYGLGQETLLLFHQLQQEGLESSAVIYSIVLKLCSRMAALEQGKLIHKYIIDAGFELDEVIGNTLIDMYAKCGSLEDAKVVFKKMPKKNVVAWNAMIQGNAWQSDINLTKQVFDEMRAEGLKPDSMTLISLISACSHRGLVDEGCQGFKWLEEMHGVMPQLQHHNCLADLLGRTGLLNEAEDLLQTLPVEPSAVGWLSLLTNCNTSGNVNLASRCFHNLVTMDCRYASGFTLMSNMYADAYMWKAVTEVQNLKTHAQAWKEPGKAFSHVDNTIHEFIVGEDVHPQSEDIYAKLNMLSALIKEGGHVPLLDLVIHAPNNIVGG